MGILKVTIEVGDSQGRQFEELDVTVDTGSTYTAVPKAMLQKLGIPVERSLPSETADGRIVPVDVGEATIRLLCAKPPKARRQNENRRCRATESSQVRCRTKTQHHAAIPNSRSLATRYSCGRSPLTLLQCPHSS